MNLRHICYDNYPFGRKDSLWGLISSEAMVVVEN